MGMKSSRLFSVHLILCIGARSRGTYSPVHSSFRFAIVYSCFIISRIILSNNHAMSQDTVIPEKELETVDPHESESPSPQGCRCIQVVSRRHSIDADGCILSDSVSKSRTPRPAVSADVEMDANEENGGISWFR